ncbi:MAG: ATPase, partial [Paracoccaceae bacterium]
EYMKRQEQHRQAEVAAMLDTARFIDRADEIYGYRNFICDTSGSVCEVVEPSNPDDPVLNALYQTMLPVLIRGGEAHEDALKARFDRAPKPMYYQESFLKAVWADYLAEADADEASVDPDAFIRYGFARLLAHRRPRYQAIADRWGVTVEAEDIAAVETGEDFTRLIAAALRKRAES